jgi:acetolactate synthase-1/2/3 large subunit
MLISTFQPKLDNLEIRITNEKTTEKVATAILSFLKKENVNFIFGMQGGYTGGIGEEINNFPELEFIHCQHEGGAAFMADGYAKTSGKFGVILTTAGPSLTNAFTGIISSLADGIPILLISGAVPHSKALIGAIQDTASFGMDVTSSFKEAVRFHADIHDKDTFLQYFREAIRYLFKGKKGPVFLNIGSDIFSQKIEHNYEYLRHSNNRFFDTESTDSVLNVLKKSRNAVIVAGNGVKLSKAQDELEIFANLLKIPVIVSPKGKSAFNNESELFLGSFGAGSNIIPDKYLKQEPIETIIALGTSFNEYSSDTWSKLIPKTYRIIQIDIDPYIIGRLFANTYGVHGDIKTTLSYLNYRIKNSEQEFDHLNSLTKIKTYRNNFKNTLKPELYTSNNVPIKPPRLLKDVYDAFSDHIVNIFNDNGSCIFWLNHYMQLRKDWNFYSSLGFSSMGYAFPAAIGGALGDPAKVTIAFAGDGAAIMNGNELKTASEYDVPVFFIVLNDSRLGIVYHSTKMIYGRENAGTEFKKPIDFVKFAESMGVEAYRIEEPGEINKEFINELIKKGKPVLFDCIIDRDELAPYEGRIKQVKK